MLPGLGIDFGAVIAERAFGDEVHPAELPPACIDPVPNAFNTIAEMNELLRGRVWIVSKSAPATKSTARAWLKYHHFSETTGVGPRQVHFVRDRSGKLEKCRELGITHFVDDRLKNLEVLVGHIEHLYLFGGDAVSQGIIAVRDWVELGCLLRQSILSDGHVPADS